MARIIITPSADADTAAIIHDLGKKAGKIVAARYDADFDQLYENLAQFPESGAPRPALGKDVRFGVVFPYIIIHEYAGDDDIVYILRIFHGRRNITRRLLRQAPRRS